VPPVGHVITTVAAHVGSLSQIIINYMMNNSRSCHCRNTVDIDTSPDTSQHRWGQLCTVPDCSCTSMPCIQRHIRWWRARTDAGRRATIVCARLCRRHDTHRWRCCTAAHVRCHRITPRRVRCARIVDGRVIHTADACRCAANGRIHTLLPAAIVCAQHDPVTLETPFSCTTRD
jgi:hypothetical protein